MKVLGIPVSWTRENRNFFRNDVTQPFAWHLRQLGGAIYGRKEIFLLFLMFTRYEQEKKNLFCHINRFFFAKKPLTNLKVTAGVGTRSSRGGRWR